MDGTGAIGRGGEAAVVTAEPRAHTCVSHGAAQCALCCAPCIARRSGAPRVLHCARADERAGVGRQRLRVQASRALDLELVPRRSSRAQQEIRPCRRPPIAASSDSSGPMPLEGAPPRSAASLQRAAGAVASRRIAHRQNARACACRVAQRRAARRTSLQLGLQVVVAAARPDARSLPRLVVQRAALHLVAVVVLVDRRAPLLLRELLTVLQKVLQALGHAPAGGRSDARSGTTSRAMAEATAGLPAWRAQALMNTCAAALCELSSFPMKSFIPP